MVDFYVEKLFSTVEIMKGLADKLIISLKNPVAATVFSIILGLGIATMFRQMCKDGVCEIVRGPSPQTLDGKIYQFGNKCHLYKVQVTECNANAI